MLTLRQLGVKIPQISPFAQNIEVDDNTIFPEFLKLSASISEWFFASTYLLKSLQWTKVVVLGTNDSYYYDQYSQAAEYAKYFGIEIVNPEDKRILPWTYTRQDFEAYKSYFQAAKDTNCRVFIITAYDRGLILEGLYDVGFRTGDFYLYTDSSIMLELIGVERVYLKKREEILKNSLVFTYKE